MNNNKNSFSQLWEQQYKSYLEDMFSDETYDYFVSVTRKGYYFSKAINPSHSYFRKILRDRDILKKYHFDELKEKKILLFDDTANTGETLKKMKERLERKTGYTARIDVAAFAISPKVLESKCKNHLFDDCNLFFKCLMNEDSMTQFSLYELDKIHDSMLPYVIDLPYFNKVELSKDQFEHLISEQKENWEFFDYSFVLQNQEYKNGFFLFENALLERIFGGTLLSALVKCRFREKEINHKVKYEMVLTPFVMLKSVIYQEMKFCSQKLFKDTPYEKYLNDATYTTDDYVAIYRDVVYNLSYFVGVLFQKYFENQYAIKLTWNLNLTVSLQNDDLKESINKIFSSFSIENYVNTLNECSFTSFKRTNIHIAKKGTATFQQVRDAILGQLSMQKLKVLYHNLETTPESNTERSDLILFEDVEEMMAQNFTYASEKEFRSYFVRIILLALDCSFMSNDLECKDGEIKRAFQFGECSEIYFGYDIRLFYFAVYTYYNSLGASEQKYQEHYKDFVSRLFSYLKNNNYFEYGYISAEVFDYFSSYFDLKDNMITREIRNKRFVLGDEYRNNPYNKAVITFVSNMKFDSDQEIEWIPKKDF